MKTKLKMFIASSVLAAGTIGTIIAFASTGSAQSETSTIPAKQQHQQTFKMANETKLANILSIDPSTLRTELANGQTLVEIAQSKGISEDTLVSDLKSAVKTQLDLKVQSGKLTSAQEQQFLSKIQSHIQQFVEHPMKKGLRHKSMKRSGINITDLTNVLQIDKSTLQSDLKNGETILQIAQAKGISEQTLVDALLSKGKSRLDQAVLNGKMTNAQEQQILSKMKNRITNFITKQKNIVTTTQLTPGSSL